MAIRIPATLEIEPEGLAAIADFLGIEPPVVPLGPPPVVRPRRSGEELVGEVERLVGPHAIEVELPEGWDFVEERSGETYHWPEGDDEYVSFRIYEGRTEDGSIRLAVGECRRVNVRGKDRKYVITHYLAPTGSKRPISEFLEVDDYEQTRDLIAIIKGSDGGAKMYDPTDELPAAYAPFRIETYRDRIDAPGSYSKLGVVAREDDIDTMLGHTLIQAQSRFGLRPS
jgi:hypothetical protein